MSLESIVTPAVITSAGGIVLAAMTIYFFWKISANHIDHSTKALTELTDMIEKLSELIEKRLK